MLREEAQTHDNEFDLFELTVPEILKKMNIEGDKQPGGKWIGDTISNYHLAVKKTRPRIGGLQTTAYTFEPTRVKELCSIYFRETSLDDVNNVHSNENNNHSAGFSVHEEESCSRTTVHRDDGNGDSVHNWSRTQEASRTMQGAEPNSKDDHVNDVHEKSEDPKGENVHLFPGEEVEL